MLTLTNPRTEATIDDWPHGFKGKVKAVFTLESNKHGNQRVSRTTTGKPKKTTYHLRMCIVDGDDGKLYLLGSTDYGQIVRIPGTLKTSEYFYPEQPEYEAYKALLYPPK